MRQVLLYRKHVITSQPYIAQLVRCLEAGGVRPVPIFINGVEAVRGPDGRSSEFRTTAAPFSDCLCPRCSASALTCHYEHDL